jgi:hypothetical protein
VGHRLLPLFCRIVSDRESFILGLKRVKNYTIHVSASVDRITEAFRAIFFCRLLVSDGYTGKLSSKKGWFPQSFTTVLFSAPLYSSRKMNSRNCTATIKQFHRKDKNVFLSCIFCATHLVYSRLQVAHISTVNISYEPWSAGDKCSSQFEHISDGWCSDLNCFTYKCSSESLTPGNGNSLDQISLTVIMLAY